MKKKAPQNAGQEITPSQSTKAQCIRLHKALINHPGGLTTNEIRQELDIMHPAARVQELRQNQGINIRTVRISIPGKQGSKHHGVARYVLLPGNWIKDDAA